MGLVYEHWRPDTNECFYVGASRDAEDTRPYEYGTHNDDYDAVVAELTEVGAAPFTKIIWDGLPRDCTFTYEKMRISYQRAVLGDKLTNRAHGGEGFNIDWTNEMRLSQALKQKEVWTNPEYSTNLSKKGKDRWGDPDFRGKMDAIMSSDEYREGQSKNQTDVWGRDEHRSKLDAIMSSQEYIEKQVSAHTTYDKLSESSTRTRVQWADKNFREEATKRSQERVTDELRQNVGQKFTALWATREHRMKMLTRSWWQSNVRNQKYWGA
jgi:hypothetical protein